MDRGAALSNGSVREQTFIDTYVSASAGELVTSVRWPVQLSGHMNLSIRLFLDVINNKEILTKQKQYWN